MRDVTEQTIIIRPDRLMLYFIALIGLIITIIVLLGKGPTPIWIRLVVAWIMPGPLIAVLNSQKIILRKDRLEYHQFWRMQTTPLTKIQIVRRIETRTRGTPATFLQLVDQGSQIITINMTFYPLDQINELVAALHLLLPQAKFENSNFFIKNV